MHFETIETERLLLRAITPETYDYVFTHYTEEAIKEFFGCATEEDLAEERKKYEQGLSMYRKSLLVFQLIEKATGKVIGWCGYHTWFILHFRAEIGYVLTDESKRGKGFMKEALPFVLNYGFKNMGLKRIEALLAPDNTASMKLITASGFVQEGLLREHYFVNGRLEDSLLFSLLEREYKHPVTRNR